MFAFMLWGRWLGTVVSLTTGAALVLAGVQRLRPLSLASALLQVVLFSTLMLGWARYRRDRLENDPVTGPPNRVALERATEDELARGASAPCDDP